MGAFGPQGNSGADSSGSAWRLLRSPRRPARRIGRSNRLLCRLPRRAKRGTAGLIESQMRAVREGLSGYAQAARLVCARFPPLHPRHCSAVVPRQAPQRNPHSELSEQGVAAEEPPPRSGETPKSPFRSCSNRRRDSSPFSQRRAARCLKNSLHAIRQLQSGEVVRRPSGAPPPGPSSWSCLRTLRIIQSIRIGLEEYSLHALLLVPKR